MNKNSFKSRLSYHNKFLEEQSSFRTHHSDPNINDQYLPDLPQQKASNLDKYMRKNDKRKEEEICYSRDIANTFYEDKISEKDSLKNIRNSLLIIFLLFFTSFVLIYFIQPYSKTCPRNAYCKVFVHCHDGYQYNNEIQHCVAQEKVTSNIKLWCQKTIKQLSQLYGDSECETEYTLPSKHVDEMIVGLPRQRRNILRNEIITYLSEEKRQQKWSYTFRNNRIIPQSKSNSFNCQLMLNLGERSVKLKIVSILFFICFGIVIYLKVVEMMKTRWIYKQLKKKVQNEGTINITYLKGQIERKYGELSEKEWKQIEQGRKKDGIQAFYDKFVYWKSKN